jgi:hypothetical protein
MATFVMDAHSYLNFGGPEMRLTTRCARDLRVVFESNGQLANKK